MPSSTTEMSIPELLFSFRSALEAAKRSRAIARALAEGCRQGLRPPDEVLDAYLARLEEDETELEAMRRRLTRVNAS